MSVNIYDRLALGALALVAVIAALTFRDYGLGWDDYTHSQYGELLLAFYASGFKDTRALSFVNLYLYGGGFDMAAALLAKILPFGLFETRRLLGAAVGILGLAVTWRIARRAGGPLAGLIALLLLAACPLYYGHMFINPKDAPFAVAMAVLLLGLVRTLDEYPKPSWTSVFILGAGVGLSVGSRIMGGFGVLYGLAAFALLFAIEARQRELRSAAARMGSCLLRLIPGVVATYALMALVWPWGAIDPLNPIRAIGIFSHFFEKPWQELFEGTLLTPPEMPRRYLPELLMRQLPELFLIAALAGVLDALLTAMRRDATPQRRALHLCVALAAVLPIAVTVLTRPAMYNGIRHFLFVLPPLAVAGGLAASLLIERANRYGGVIRAMILAVAIGGMALPVIGIVRLHPYQYVWFNHVTGGVQRARSEFMLDYWGLSLKQAAEALRAHLAARGEMPPAGRKWKVAVCGPHPGAQIALGDAFEPTWAPNGADFALMLGEFYCARLDAPAIARIERANVTLARIHDIRGWTVPALFTIPPVERDNPALPTR
jgi:4-amino-4-deoxy-L-arabinose transferase-like glycosyltransferase